MGQLAFPGVRSALGPRLVSQGRRVGALRAGPGLWAPTFKEVSLDASGATGEIVTLGPGLYLWLVAPGLPSLAFLRRGDSPRTRSTWVLALCGLLLALFFGLACFEDFEGRTQRRRQYGEFLKKAQQAADEGDWVGAQEAAKRALKLGPKSTDAATGVLEQVALAEAKADLAAKRWLKAHTTISRLYDYPGLEVSSAELNELKPGAEEGQKGAERAPSDGAPTQAPEAAPAPRSP